MADYTASVGNVEMVSLTDGQGDRDPVETFPDSTGEQWRAEYPELLDSSGRIHPRYGSVAVRSNGKLIFVDTGLQVPDGTLLDEMRRKGVERDAVDIVVLTHLHGDHVGWNLTDGRPTFPNARYLVTRADWDYWTTPSVQEGAPHIREQVLPLQDLDILDLIEGDYEITGELTAISTPGHTPGHISIAISSVGERGLILGDVAHSPAQAHHTDWNPIFDIDQIQSRKTRHRILDRLEGDASLVSAGHFPGSGFGRFVRAEGRRVWRGI